jgi:hypothetical protein
VHVPLLTASTRALPSLDLHLRGQRFPVSYTATPSEVYQHDGIKGELHVHCWEARFVQVRVHSRGFCASSNVLPDAGMAVRLVHMSDDLVFDDL